VRTELFCHWRVPRHVYTGIGMNWNFSDRSVFEICPAVLKQTREYVWWFCITWRATSSRKLFSYIFILNYTISCCIRNAVYGTCKSSLLRYFGQIKTSRWTCHLFWLFVNTAWTIILYFTSVKNRMSFVFHLFTIINAHDIAEIRISWKSYIGYSV